MTASKQRSSAASGSRSAASTKTAQRGNQESRGSSAASTKTAQRGDQEPRGPIAAGKRGGQSSAPSGDSGGIASIPRRKQSGSLPPFDPSLRPQGLAAASPAEIRALEAEALATRMGYADLDPKQAQQPLRPTLTPAASVPQPAQQAPQFVPLPGEDYAAFVSRMQSVGFGTGRGTFATPMAPESSPFSMPALGQTLPPVDFLPQDLLGEGMLPPLSGGGGGVRPAPGQTLPPVDFLPQDLLGEGMLPPRAAPGQTLPTKPSSPPSRPASGGRGDWLNPDGTPTGALIRFGGPDLQQGTPLTPEQLERYELGGPPAAAAPPTLAPVVPPVAMPAMPAMPVTPQMPASPGLAPTPTAAGVPATGIGLGIREGIQAVGDAFGGAGEQFGEFISNFGRANEYNPMTTDAQGRPSYQPNSFRGDQGSQGSQGSLATAAPSTDIPSDAPPWWPPGMPWPPVPPQATPTPPPAFEPYQYDSTGGGVSPYYQSYGDLSRAAGLVGMKEGGMVRPSMTNAFTPGSYYASYDPFKRGVGGM